MDTDCFADTDNTDVRAEQGAGKKNNHGAHRVIARRKKKGMQRREEYENPQMTKLKELKDFRHCELREKYHG